MNNYRPKTFFIDIDGTLLQQFDFEEMLVAKTETEIENLTVPFRVAVERLNEWFMRGDHIVLTTARPENLREFTVKQMAIAGIQFNQLVMGIGRSTRVLINNLSDTPEKERRAQAYEVHKNDEEAFNLIDE